MKILTIIAHVLLGLGFVVFGSNAFLHFLPMPPIPQTLAGDYTRVFFASGYVYVVGALQVIGGLLLLLGRFVPLGLTILGAILVNILIFHTLMAPEGFPPALVFTALELFLVWRYREAFIPLLRPYDLGYSYNPSKSWRPNLRTQSLRCQKSFCKSCKNYTRGFSAACETNLGKVLHRSRLCGIGFRKVRNNGEPCSSFLIRCSDE